MSDDIIFGGTAPECGRCGTEMEFDECAECGGEGGFDAYEQDPLWYNEGDITACTMCDGMGGWWTCGSDPDWCDAHPIEGREDVKRGTIIKQDEATP